jgi:hypothetical protein
VEVVPLTPQEVDFDHRLILPRTAKNGAPRALKFSLKLEAMLREYIQRENIQPTERVFKTTARNYSQMFRISRNALAKKLKEPTSGALDFMTLDTFRNKSLLQDERPTFS